MTDSSLRGRLRTLGLVLAVGAAAGFLLLAVPARPAPTPELAPAPFRWNASDLVASLEADFEQARQTPLADAEAGADALDALGDGLLVAIAESEVTPLAALTSLADRQFDYALIGAAHASLLPRAEAFVLRARTTVLRAASAWPAERSTHEAMYRVVFGGRMAMEEALIQAGPNVLPELLEIEVGESATPFIDVEGVRVHSGDILLSRGGAPTSALIARGSDFANTFSHAALAHVDAETGIGTVVESLIETGSVLTTVEEFLAYKSHRVLVLRLRPDHPALMGDPLLPHRAATAMLDQLRANPVPYDFAMDWAEASKMFCAEVVFHAYLEQGVELWPIRSAMSAPGLVRWLSGMGVREFQTLVPSDLEYDPQLLPVVEWRNAAALQEYRLDNAITDVLLEDADRGTDLGYAWYTLPMGRVLKGLSVAQSWLGWQPIIPTGMDASAALRVSALVTVVNPTLKGDLLLRESQFLDEQGFRAPYWILVDLARGSLSDLKSDLSPALR